MSDCEVPDCIEEARYIFRDWQHQAGYPISLCQEHLDAALEECYSVIIKSYKGTES